MLEIFPLWSTSSFLLVPLNDGKHCDNYSHFAESKDADSSQQHLKFRMEDAALLYESIKEENQSAANLTVA